MSSPAFTTTAFPTIRSIDAERELASARTRGHAAGYAEGIRRAEQESAVRELARQSAADAQRARDGELLAHGRAVLAAATSALHARVVETIESVESALAVASLELAEAVLGSELSRGETSARTALVRALGQDDARFAVSIRLHPNDLEVLRASDSDDVGVPLVADTALRPGDAIVELPVGYLDVQIASALERARAALVGSSR
ncbi:FliH/SctL family protein [Glaciibacter psychrotolerans]|uniref:Flagellar assembly protein FliH n=1 Tax=Glaciibacter psychrotolerans TaxID=670054 RepID=A0A7Z0ECQ3_9MICO|nr:FliH/SctL family protein [Leifsonia psychrotolerans]NYJ18760.1 flagellar assembly protein FliH [Leifsonia psychrotolerans]